MNGWSGRAALLPSNRVRLASCRFHCHEGKIVILEMGIEHGEMARSLPSSGQVALVGVAMTGKPDPGPRERGRPGQAVLRVRDAPLGRGRVF